MRWFKKCPHRHDSTMWHLSFAWLPVKTVDLYTNGMDRMVWLERVWRRQTGESGHAAGATYPIYEYKETID